MLHSERSIYAGKVVRLKDTVPEIGGQEIIIEDWWDRVYGKSWMIANGNPAALIYAIRSASIETATDDNVLYGKIDGLGHLVHMSWIVLED